ncbi:SRPBCC domain-containing protein [Kribbella sp. CA-294648]|uniref:SRPBCC domain-containing protein n=1 Tax=Kribbella sp. CA-294648 TaxID=3239948 RepID=UPI003D89DBCA
MTEGTQIFEIYIRATPEQIWAAITSNEFRVKYFHGGRAESSWETGARLRTVGPDGDLWGDNEILQSDPPKLLSHTGAVCTTRRWRPSQRAASRGRSSP